MQACGREGCSTGQGLPGWGRDGGVGGIEYMVITFFFQRPHRVDLLGSLVAQDTMEALPSDRDALEHASGARPPLGSNMITVFTPYWSAHYVPVDLSVSE